MQSLILEYLRWHYFDKLKYYFLIWKNILIFLSNYFSIFHLLKTLFSPWHAYREEYGNILEFRRNLEALLFNNFARFIGFIIRIVVIAVGLAAQAAVFFGGLIFFALWVFLPFILAFLLVFGIRQVFF